MRVEPRQGRIVVRHAAPAIRHSNEGDELRREVHGSIGRSFHRLADTDLTNVGVTCESGVVWLSGRVQSFAARISAEHAAWAIPGVIAVHNDILVGSYDPQVRAPVDGTT